MRTAAVAVTGRGVVPVETPVLRADDEALLRGRAVFETTRVYDGRPFRLGAHLERLARSAERVGVEPPPREELQRLVGEALDASGLADAALRIYWTPGGVGIVLVSEISPDLAELRARGLKLVSLSGPGGDAPWLLGGVKSTSYAVNIAAQDEARRRGADDAVFLSPAGVVLECPTANVWWRRGERLFTPALELGILAGVTRAAVLELSPWPVEEGAFPVDELYDADEVFTSSAVREVMPAVELDGRTIPRGEAAAELQAALRRAAAAA